MKVILVYGFDDLEQQVSALKSAMQHLKKEGDLCGIRVGKNYYGVRRNKRSFTVTPQASNG